MEVGKIELYNCTGCCHYDCCGMREPLFKNENAQMTDIELFEAHCVGCCCGDGFECNNGRGCDNYEEEPWLG